MNISADFQRFTDFAAAVNGGSKNIADAANGMFDVGGLHRSVVSSSGDKVGAFSRSQTAKDVNNVTRDIFLKTVSDMFDGNIPSSVKKAMNIGKFDGKGRPLTAKRILIVKAAIEKYNGDGKTDGVKAMSAASYAKDMRPVTLTQKQAEKMISTSCKFFRASFSSDQKKELAQVLLAHGQDLPAKNLRMLSNYIVNRAINDFGVDEDDVAGLAKNMKTWSEFKFGDARLNELCAKFIQRHTAYVNEKINDPKSFSEDKNGAIFNQVYADAARGEWNINGRKFSPSKVEGMAEQNTANVTNALADAVKSPKARQMISILLNQGGLADMECVICKCAVSADPATIGKGGGAFENLHTLSGGELFISREGGAPMLVDKMASYGLEVSKDGKTATLTLSVDKNVTSTGGAYNEYNIGIATVTQKIKIDLSDDNNPKIVDVMFSQTYSPDKVWINKDQKPLEG